MAKFPVNPLKWFQKKEAVSQASPRPQASTARPAAQPKKSGGIFMHLITLQKNLQSIELALQQQIECNWLLQKAKTIVSALRGEAEKAEEEELAQGSGQVLAYLDTVLDGRLDFDEEGVSVIKDFVIIFKDALGDAAPGIRMLNVNELEEWNGRYQRLMARMKPVEENSASEVEGPPGFDEQPVSIIEIDNIFETAGLIDGQQYPGASEERQDEAEFLGTSEQSAPLRIDPIHADENLIEADSAPSVEETEAVPPIESETDAEVIPFRPHEAVPPVEEPPEIEIEVIPIGADEANIKDVIIPDAEMKSARELLESDQPPPPPPQLDPPKRTAVEKIGGPAGNGQSGVKTPVQLEEVERLKRKLLQLHEKQEILSTKMSGMLGDLKKAVRTDQKPPAAVSIEKMDIDELEDLIFIGREKG
ncbi:MAG: hypothetical protein C4520_01340 [Candidatus Abyssobacteria bacterium SURF_5]|uniref:Uncharacterized protein n=1 Tax=Abyssobacteria bacterium (strain SURF_5) TaxID=2093360 RepID=A0A3A4P692_ABYX5|nr:MAG: hypothetical protein C4520_01340 [Candidatus Abyssubacteria bacterium SURF_5]